MGEGVAEPQVDPVFLERAGLNITGDRIEDLAVGLLGVPVYQVVRPDDYRHSDVETSPVFIASTGELLAMPFAS